MGVWVSTGMAIGKTGMVSGQCRRDGVREHLSIDMQPHPYWDFGTTVVLPRAEQTEISQYSHFTFALLTLMKHHGFLSPSGFLK